MTQQQTGGFLSHTLCGIRVSALVEGSSFFAIALLIDSIMGDGARFSSLLPHPFWAILLLISVQYGAKEALLCALAASACLLIGNMPPQDINENSYDYIFRVIHLPILWVSTGAILGAIRSRHLHEKKRLDEKLVYTETMNDTITQAYQHLRRAKEGLELRLAEEQHSSIVVYEAAKALETIDQRKLLKAVKNIVSTTLKPAKFSIYAAQPMGLESIACHGWNNEEQYALSFPVNSPLYNSIMVEKRVVCVVNEEDERVLARQGILAGPIIDSQTKEIFGMLKIEETGILSVGMRSVEIFKVLCEWIGMAYANARKYQIATGKVVVNMPARAPAKEAVYNARTTIAH